jgi:DNA invertase Pin-like site-specific DNA recombinase/transposase
MFDLDAAVEQEEVLSIQPRKAVLYARLSRHRNGLDSIARQIDSGRRWARKHNVEIVEIFTDVQSGKSRRGRTGLEDALRRIEEGGIDLLIVEQFSRLARSLADGSTVFRLLRFHNVDLVSIYQGKANIVNLAQKLAEAEGYVDENVRMVRDTLRKKFTEGTFDGFPRYGYRSQRHADGDKINGKLEIVPETVPIIVWIFDAIAAGMRASSVVRHLNDQGIPGPSGMAWSTAYLLGDSEVGGMLRCDTYMGWATWEKTSNHENPSTFQISRKRNKKYFVRLAPHLKIVERDVWERVQQVLDSQKRVSFDSSETICSKNCGRSESLLSGIMKCEECGATMHAQGIHQSKKTGEVTSRPYKCSRFLSLRYVNRHDIFKCGNARVVNGSLVETAIIEEICSQLEGPIPFRAFTARYKETRRRGADQRDKSKIRAIKDRIAINDKRIAGYTAAFESHTWDVDFIGTQITPLVRENSLLKKQLSDLEEEKPELSFQVNKLDDYKSMADAVRRCLPVQPRSDRELIAVASLKSLISNVIVRLDPNSRDFNVEFSLFVGELVSDEEALQGDEEEGWLRLSRTVHVRRNWAENSIVSTQCQPALALDIPQMPQEAWIEINALLTRSKNSRKNAHATDRRALEHILFKFTTNTLFKDLPSKGGLCYSRLQKWDQDGVWPDIFRILEEKFPELLSGFNYLMFESMFETDNHRAQALCQILRQKGEPMTLGQLWEAMIDRGVWPSRGDSGKYRLQAILDGTSQVVGLPGYGYRLADIPLAAANINFHHAMPRSSVRRLDSNAQAPIRDDALLDSGHLEKGKKHIFFVTNQDWNAIKPLLPFPRKITWKIRYDDRVVVSAIAYVFRTGITWKQLPQCFGPWKSIYSRFCLWKKKGIIERIRGILMGINPNLAQLS